jgi:pimeloyl-ACP methyl ester carboxylesterase
MAPMDLTSAMRVAGRGVAAAGVLAAGAAVGVLAERALIRRSARVDDDDESLGSLRGEERELITADGTRLHVEVDEPDDPAAADLTVVFCHGYALTQDSWHYQRKDLRGSARLVFYDQRSHGRSTKAEFDTHHVDQLGSDLAAVIEAVVPEGPIVLVGHSMGGMSVMAYAEQHPNVIGSRVRGVALVATTAGGVRANTLGMPGPLGRLVQSWAPPIAEFLAEREHLVEGWSDSDLGLLLTRVYSFGSPASDQAGRFVARMLAGTSLEVVADFLPALHEHDKHDVLPIFQNAELLVIVGASDRLTPPELSEEIVAAVPGAEFAVLGDSGHMVMLERPTEVSELLAGLIARVRRDLVATRGAA